MRTTGLHRPHGGFSGAHEQAQQPTVVRVVDVVASVLGDRHVNVSVLGEIVVVDALGCRRSVGISCVLQTTRV